MNTTLHMVLGSRDSLASCLHFVRPGDQVLLAGAGVLVLAGELPAMDAAPELLALQADVAARGLLQHAACAKVGLVNDLRWVELVTRHQHTLSWK